MMLKKQRKVRPNTGTKKSFGKTEGYLYSLMIALIPALMMYKVPVGVGLSTLLIVATMPYAALRAILVSGMGSYKMVIPMVAYCGYVIARSNGDITNILLTVTIIVHLLAAASGAVRLFYTRKVIEAVSTLAAVGVIIQSIAHYLLHVHIPMIVGSWVLDEMESYRMYITTGISAAEDHLYRPSAFFLEPAHLAQYAIVGLISCLFRPKPHYRTAAVISLGILLTTSGMGMVLTVFAWGAYMLRLLRKSNTQNNVTQLMSVVIVSVVVVALLTQSSIMQSSLSRITGGVMSSTSGYNAISGRTLFWKVYIAPLSGNSLLWGKGFAALPDVYFTGLMEMLFCYGLAGVSLFYITVIGITIKSSGFGRCVAISVGGLMLIANPSGFLSFIYLFGMLYASRRQQQTVIVGLLPVSRPVALRMPQQPRESAECQ